MTPRGKIRIDKELCKGCGYCVEACPSAMIAIGQQFNRQGYFPATVQQPSRCTGCAMCAMVCPEIAITVYRRENGKKPHARIHRSRD